MRKAPIIANLNGFIVRDDGLQWLISHENQPTRILGYCISRKGVERYIPHLPDDWPEHHPETERQRAIILARRPSTKKTKIAPCRGSEPAEDAA